MSHTNEGHWLDRAPRTVLLTAYQTHGQWKLLVQEHDNTVSGALRPNYVGTFALWQAGVEGMPTNMAVMLAIQDALTKMMVDARTQWKKLNRK